MISAGNDIVALAAIDIARTKQPKFYSRIISVTEEELYHAHFQNQLPFEHFVWLVWSVKESVYKYLKRFDPELVFSPLKMRIVQLTQTTEYFEGTVQFGNKLLYSQSIINNDFIFSIVNDKADFAKTHWDIKQIDSANHVSQSAAVRQFLTGKLDQLFPYANLQITKSPYGWPIVANDAGELPVAVSFTHHDHFVAYSFQLTDSQWKANQLHAEIL